MVTTSFNFYTRHKVDGKGFSSQMPTLKTVLSDQKSNCRTCTEECQMPFNLKPLGLKIKRNIISTELVTLKKLKVCAPVFLALTRVTGNILYT